LECKKKEEIEMSKHKFDSYATPYSKTTDLDTIDDRTEKEVRIFSDNKWAYDYISKLKIGNFINFSEKEGNKKIIRSGIVNKIYGDKFCMTIMTKNRKFVKVVMINDIITKAFYDER
jgi:hypothetical protein